ncbi:MAG TPA: hypothetical protein VHF69_09495, partial [Candidatus Synoicihabitans sp.]|nr:hypothetical protein [Candidatus Synoicihabitans sp.]
FGEEAPPEYRPWGHGTSPLDPWANFPVAVIGCSAQVLFRRTALIDLGGWETRFPGVGDVHAWLTLTARRPFLQLEGETVGHRQHRASAQGPVKRRNRWDYCDRYLSAAQDRLPLRLRYHQSEAVRTRGRLRLARYLFAWRFADAMLGPSQSTPLGIRVDPLFAEESPEAQQTLLEQAFWFFPVEEEATRLTRTVGLIRLWQRCPREAPHLRAALRAYLQRRVSGALHALGA